VTCCCCLLHVGGIRSSHRMIELTPRDLKPYTHGHWDRNGQHACAFVEGLKYLSEQGFGICVYCFRLITDALTDLTPFQTRLGERNNRRFNFLFSLGTIVSPKRNWKKCYCKIWGDKQRVLWYFPKWPIGFLDKESHAHA